MSITRRDLLAGGAAAGVASLLPRLAEASVAKPYRFVHMTDFHVQPEMNAPKGMEAALRHAMAKKPKMAMLGGDLIMDGFKASKNRTKTQWDIFTSLLKATCGVPTRYCVGNRDVWGWDKAASHTSG